MVHGDDEVFNVAKAGKELAGIDVEPFAAFHDVAAGNAEVGGADRLRHLADRHAMRGEARQVEIDADLFAAAAGDETLPRVRQRLEALVDVERQLSQLHEVELVRTERDREDRHVVDALRLDQRLHHALGNGVHMRIELVVKFYERRLHLFADVEAHRHHGQAVARHRIDVLDARQFRH